MGHDDADSNLDERQTPAAPDVSKPRRRRRWLRWAFLWLPLLFVVAMAVGVWLEKFYSAKRPG